MLLVDNSVLSLHLLEDTLYLDLDADDEDNASKTTVLRGFVDVTNPKKKRVHSLLICFEGYLSTKQPSGKCFFSFISFLSVVKNGTPLYVYIEIILCTQYERDWFNDTWY